MQVATPRSWLRPALLPDLLTGFAAATLVVLLAGFLTYRAARDFTASSRLVLHSQQVLESLSTFEVAYVETVNATLAFAATGDRTHIAERDESTARLTTTLDALTALTRDDAEQQYALAELRRQIPVTPEVATPDRQLQLLLDQVRQRARILLTARRQLDESRTVRLRNTVAASVLGTLIMLGLLFWRTRRHLRDRIRAEQEVDWQRRFADAVINGAPMGIYVKDARDLTIVRANKVMAEMLGVTQDSIPGKDDYFFFPEDEARQNIAADREIIRQHQVISDEEMKITTPRGKRRLRCRKVLIDDRQNQATFLVGLIEDVTERREAEALRQDYAEQLEHKGHELTIANKELESFSYSVSHDLRAPLRAISGYALMLEEDHSNQLDDEGRRVLRAIRDAAARMGVLIQDLLSFSRLSRQPLQPVDSDTRDLVSSAWESLRAAHPDQRAQLTIGDLPESHGDPRLLLQIWANLLENAAKYSDKAAEPRIEVSGSVVGGEAVFCVRDNGVGFDMRYYDKLFKVFQRLHTEAEYSGSGVGLAIVQRITARHGGRCWADATPGKGANFYFALPTAAASQTILAKAG